MKKLKIITTLFLINFAVISAQTKKVEVIETPQNQPRISKSRNQAEKQLEELEHKLSGALVSKDATILDKLIADDFTIAGSNITKQTYAALITNPQINFTSVEKSEMRVKIYGETAVITGRNNTSRKIENGSSSSVFNFMDVWVKAESGDWQCVAMSVDSINLIFAP